jgi:diaminopimelate decarboxylase
VSSRAPSTHPVSQTRFEVPVRTGRFWIRLVRPLLAREPTPFYLFSVVPVQEALEALENSLTGLPVRCWFSAKTQPLPPLWRWWKDLGRPIEVVSAFELQAALAAGFAPDRILINGPAKHHWLPRFGQRGFWVNLDSPAEAVALTPLALRRDWQLGLRLHLPAEHGRASSSDSSQFGMDPSAAALVLRQLRRRGVEPVVLHFHLGTQVPSVARYARALEEAARVCRRCGWHPRYVDCGGGWPSEFTWDRTGRPMARDFSLQAMARVLARARSWFPRLEEYWLENGRWLTAGSGVLVVKILDVKQRRGLRYLICDGGRTLHALVATWEQHPLLAIPTRKGRRMLTSVAGPTCMAFDQLALGYMPIGLRPGDRLVWLGAGAYHLSWETRFSHGLAAVYWHDGREIHQVRPPETFEDWWGRWAPVP